MAGPNDKIFYIAKPFEIAEIIQTATALCQRCAIATLTLRSPPQMNRLAAA